MITPLKKLGLLLLAGMITISSCKKEEEATPEEETPVPTVTTPGTPGTTVPGSDGTFVNLKSVVYTTMILPFVGANTTKVYSESSIASVMTSSTSSTLVDAGVVKCNDSTLTKQSNNSYIFTKQNSNSTSSFTTFFNSGAYWDISGNSGNSVPAFTSSTYAIPSTPQLTFPTDSAPTISKSGSYYVYFGYISNCDSVICQIVGGNGTVLTSKPLAPGAYGHTFTSAEMGTLQPSLTTGGIPTGQIGVYAYKYSSQTVSGKKYWYINIGAKTYMANIK
ncbi:MAG: hypothetical protein J0M08_02260 [Bacteroidetes bacterium]|nr:hypothetical protein [Bacteroidota bacterium]